MRQLQMSPVEFVQKRNLQGILRTPHHRLLMVAGQKYLDSSKSWVTGKEGLEQCGAWEYGTQKLHLTVTSVRRCAWRTAIAAVLWSGVPGCSPAAQPMDLRLLWGIDALGGDKAWAHWNEHFFIQHVPIRDSRESTGHSAAFLTVN